MKSQIRTMKGMLRQLDRFFADNTVVTEEHHKLWDVLTALRGPDSCNMNTKEATTAVIRHAVFPQGRSNIPANIGMDDTWAAERRAKMKNNGSHFWDHAWHAFNALGLKWNSTNYPKAD